MNQTTLGNPIHLTVIDDHPVVFLGVQYALRKCKSTPVLLVNQFTNGFDALKEIDRLNSEVVLIDLFLPDINGTDLARRMLDLKPELKIGIYSSMLEKKYIVSAFKKGALGYLPKTATPDEIIDFVTTIHKGERYIRGVVADILFSEEPAIKNISSITNREKEILELVLDGCKNKEIAEKLNIAERTVEFHKQNLYLKLEVNNSVDLYKAAHRFNLLPDM